MIVISNSLVLTAAETVNALNPVIGWHTIVTAANVVATTEASGYPASNVANPATHLFWRASVNAGDDYLTVTTGYLGSIDYLAVARHNFGSGGVAVSVEGAAGIDTSQKILLHFDGADASTIITDNNVGGSAHTWTAVGNAQIDTALSKFGGASLLCDGTGDYVTTPDHADFALGSSNFTIECWFNSTRAAGLSSGICGQGDATFSASSSVLLYYSGTTFRGLLQVGASQFTVLGTTPFSATENPGWHHIAFVRSGSTLYLFIDGVLDGTGSVTGSVNNSSDVFTVGGLAGFATLEWKGWIDEFRLTVGVAKWTSNFVPYGGAYDSLNWTALTQDVIPADDSPLIFRFTPQVLTSVRLRMQQAAVAPEVGVLYVGKLLVLERSIRIDVDHTPFNLGQVTKVSTGKSESGHFLGRTVLNRKSVSTADFDHFTPAWFRANFQPFIIVAQQDPFFFAWNPSEYPLEVGYAWLAEDPKPGVDPVTRRLGVQLKMEGLVV